MALTYSSFVSEIATITAISSNTLVNGDTAFAGPMPFIIDQAEGMIYRALDLPAVKTSVGPFLSSGVSTVLISTFGVEILAITDVALLASSGQTIIPLVPTTRAVIDACYPSAGIGSAIPSSNCGPPVYVARLSNAQLYFGPAPDLPYQVSVVGTIRPVALSAANSSTWLTQNLPELMVAAGMIAATGYMRNFGSQADNPQMSISWKGVYDDLLKSATVDSFRMKFQSQGWQSQIPNPIATPPRV